MLPALSSASTAADITSHPMPGRLGSSAIYKIQLGTADMFFYMSAEKAQLMQNLIPEVQENLVLTAVSSELEFSVVEVTPSASTHSSPQDPFYDEKGMKILKEYTDRVMNIFERLFEVKLAAPPSWNFNFIYSQDNMKYHQDQFQHQYNDIQTLPTPLKPLSLVQDITLYDLEMSEGTFSGTIFQLPDSDDRFMITLFPHEVVGTLFVESIPIEDPLRHPEYPGAKSLPPHAPTAPIDEFATQTSGSAKGKRISTVARGIVETDQLESISRTAIPLPLEIGIHSRDYLNKMQCVYPNGIVLKQLPSELPAAHLGLNFRRADQEGIEIYKTASQEQQATIEMLQQMFDFNYSLDEVQVFRLVKKGTGFSFLANIDLTIQSHSQVIIINQSKIPEPGYKNYHLADFAPGEHLPWIHFYPFSPAMAMKVPTEILPKLALTPIEEILFRDALWDISWKDPSNLNTKIVTELDVFIFTKEI